VSAVGVGAPPAFLAAEEELALLGAARESIAARLEGREPRLPSAEGGLLRPQGAFVSLHRRRDGELRGCVGTMRSEEPLVATVARMAVAAAFEDGRFPPLRAPELPGVRLEISVLSPLEPIRPEDVVVGRHGLLIGRGGRRGVLLPQVPVAHGWDRETFLGHLCAKAGLPAEAWRDPAVELAGFTARFFAEE
jgi:AmmeMemoRadiSam system protein A